jgi:alpha-tubulin suppressor-like RCC1 family protein
MDFMNSMTRSARVGLSLWYFFPVSILLLLLENPAAANLVTAWGNPTNVPAGANQAVAISAGWGYSLGITKYGELLDWGTDPGSPPAKATNLVAVSASFGHSLALRSDGVVIGWGSLNRVYAWEIPEQIGSDVKAISANGDGDGDQSLVLESNGTVVAWGNVSTVPDGLTNVVAIAAGGWHDLALKGDGTVVAWGDDTYQQTNVPAGLSNVVAIAAGDFHSLALKSDSTVVAWGWDGEGELDIPTGLSNVVAIAAGTYDSLALKSDGSVVAWGATYPPINSGQADVPAGLTNVVAISAGAGHSLALGISLQIDAISLTNQNPVLHFHTFAGNVYRVDYTSYLGGGSWTPLSTGSVSGDGKDATVTDPTSIGAGTARFYRLAQ